MTQASQTLSSQGSAPCELLLKLFSGPRGDVHLARFVRGDDAGRFIMLREVAEASANRLAPTIDLARSVAHPKLLKLLGFVRNGGRIYIACEYVPGAALTELRQAVRKQRSPVRAAVAARIVRDALDASETAGSLVHDACGLEAFTAFHPDSIWIAEFGETMVVPIGAHEVLAAPRASEPPPGSQTAIDLLLELATALPSTQVLAEGVENHLPAALADAVLAALAAADVDAGESTDSALLAALLPLKSPTIADDRQVQQELERVLASTLDQRRKRQGTSDEEDETNANDATVVGHISLQRRSSSALEPKGDEHTRLLETAFKGSHPDRVYDPDGVTLIAQTDSSANVVSSDKLPSPASISNPSWPQQFLEQTQPSKSKRPISLPPEPAQRGNKVLVAMTLLVALVLAVTYWSVTH